MIADGKEYPVSPHRWEQLLNEESQQRPADYRQV